MNEFTKIGLEINVKKSACLRVGLRHRAYVEPISLNNRPVKWESEISYLGIQILSGKRFSINSQHSKQKYFRALNAIFEKIGLNPRLW